MAEKAENGEPLEQMCDGPRDVGRFLKLAVAIAAAVGQFHKKNLVHGSIKPQTILVDPRSGAITLTDSSPASGLPHECLRREPPRKIEETLAYISPEQTGRVNQLVDYRSDLYSLGVTFYKMLTGQLPFQARDPLEWVHCHIARMPRPITDIVPTIPRAISAVVMKLLSKKAEGRYQTAEGLKYDLEKCLAAWEATGRIDTFVLGESDLSDRLLIPQKLYGREKDISTLLSAFDTVIERGRPELVMVGGYAGVGKTSLVRELYKPVVRDHGFFISGKSDQYKRNIPYSTIAEAFRELIQHILTESDEQIAAWRRRIQGALGRSGQLIVEAIPQVELIVGKQPPVQELPPVETQNRFNMVFRKFIGEFTKKEHPLVVFLDDLQWVDAASLKLLEHIVTNPDTEYLLLIGAYRDNELNSSHPLVLTLDDIRRSSVGLRTITLSPLSFDDLSRLNVDTFHAAFDRVRPLTTLVYEKTAGNPFFVIQFLRTLYAENLVMFDRDAAAWKWDVSHIQSKGYTDNVVDLMAGKLKRLSESTQMILRLAACIGNKFHLQTLAVIADMSDGETRQALVEGMKEGLVLKLTEDSYTFFHDRVQQAAYSLIPEGRRAAAHRQIGRLLLDRTSPEAMEEQVFDIVSHFNVGTELISARSERYRVAELNLMAGKKAKASTAYESAFAYLSVASRLLNDAAWDTHYNTMFELYKELAAVEYLNTRYARSQDWINVLLGKARSNIEKAQLYNILIVEYTLMAKYAEAMDAGRKALQLLHVRLPETNLREELTAELATNKKILGGRNILSLADEPEMSDPEKRVTLELLSNMLVPTRYTDGLLFAVASVINVNLSLRYGLVRKSPVGYTAYGMFLGAKMNKYREGYEFGELAVKVTERFNDLSQKCQACFVLANYLNHWVRHLKWADDLNDAGYDAGLASGELQWTGYLVAYRLFQPFYRGIPIQQIEKRVPHLLLFTEKTENQWATDTLQGLGLALSDLQTEPRESPAHGGDFGESEYMALCKEHRSHGAIARYAVLKAQIHYLYGRMEKALEFVSMASEAIEFITCSISVAEHNFYHSLALTALYDTASDDARLDYLGTIRVNQEQMGIWADNCPENFEHQYLLVQAEIARITGKDVEAMRLFEQAIRSAQANEFVQNEAIAHELAARFYEQCGIQRIADKCLQDARDCYARWGADGKVKQLDEHYPWLKDASRGSVLKEHGPEVGQLDAITVVKALQAISGEIILSNLLQTLMRIVIENAGAQKGLLILVQDEDLTIAAEAEVSGQEIEVFQPRPTHLSSLLPLSVINYVKRTGESIILDDATEEKMFSSDEYIVKNKPVSVLCLPILRQAALIGLWYLENNLVRGAFTAERIAVLELVASQAAISLENATLYQDLRRAEEKYRGIFENIMEGIFQTTPDGRFISANPALARMLGYDFPEELMGDVTDVDRQIYADSQDRIQLTKLLRDHGSVRRFEFRAVRKDGAKIWFSLSGREVRDIDGTLLYYEGTVEDVTERKQAEEERFRLATAIEQAADGIIITDPQWIIQYANPAFERLSGYEAHEIIGQHTRVLRSDKHDREFFKNIRDTLARGEVWSGHLINKKKDGTFYEAEVTGSPVRDESGAIINHVSSHRDVTHEVRLERELRQAQRMEAIGTLAGGIAHDFNNILMAMTGYTELAHSKAPEESSIRRHLDQVLQAGSRAKALVKQILTFSRQGEQERRPEPVAPIVIEALKLLRSSLPSTIEMRQEIAIPWDKTMVLADPTQIHQLLMNLCTNAAHAMRAKGGSLHVALSETVVNASLAARYRDLNQGPHLLLTVRDTGHGMDEGVMERVFDPYFTTKGPGEGTGLGLSVVQGIIKSLGGAITVDSEVGQGTTFHVFLPKIEEEVSLDAQAVNVLPTGDERILLVDDEQVLVELGAEMLESLGYKVTIETRSPQALEVFRSQPDAFDLVITDMTMPGLTGRDLAKKLMTIRPDLPVILCTGFSELINGTQATETGIRAFVMKPYMLNKLAMIVRKVLDED